METCAVPQTLGVPGAIQSSEIPNHLPQLASFLIALFESDGVPANRSDLGDCGRGLGMGAAF